MANDVTFKRKEYIQHKHQWELCLNIYNGIDTAKALTIKNPNEYTEDFKNRVERATLDNYIERKDNPEIKRLYGTSFGIGQAHSSERIGFQYLLRYAKE